MDVIVYLLVLALSGLVVGALGRLAIPGKDPMSIWMTILVGLAGSFLGGIVWWVIFRRNGGGIILSVIFAALIVYLIRRSRGGTLTQPPADPPSA
jgi:uncharacterized membrane protein YeaQ/YmgE (transglycosylase-associated protein family)